MPEPTKVSKADKSYLVKDETKRPLTMVRLRFHPNKPQLVAQMVDRRLAVWDLNAPPAEGKDRVNVAGPVVLGTRHCEHQLGWIRGFDISPDGQWLATGGSDRRLKLWRWEGSKPTNQPAADIAAHDGWIEAVTFSPDGKCLATAGSDRVIKIWNAADLKPIRTLTGHSGIIRDLVWNGSALISGGEEGKVIVWNAQSFEPVRTIDFGDAGDQQGQHPQVSGVHGLACSRDGRWLAVAGDKKTIIFDLGNGEPVASDAAKLQAAFHPSLCLLAAGGDTVKVWLYQPDQLMPAMRDKTGKLAAPKAPGKELGSIKLGDFALGIAFAPDGKHLALGKSSGAVELWEIA